MYETVLIFPRHTTTV